MGYNVVLGAIPGETINLATQHPEMLATIEGLMTKAHTPSKEFPFPGLD